MKTPDVCVACKQPKIQGKVLHQSYCPLSSTGYPHYEDADPIKRSKVVHHPDKKDRK